MAEMEQAKYGLRRAKAAGKRSKPNMACKRLANGLRRKMIRINKQQINNINNR